MVPFPNQETNVKIVLQIHKCYCKHSSLGDLPVKQCVLDLSMVCVIRVSVVAVAILFELSLGQELDSIFHNTSITHNESSFINGESCPTWHLWNNRTNKCVCKDIDAIVKCNPATTEVALMYGYCMTYDNDTGTTHVGKCFYTLFDRHNESWYTHLPRNPVYLNAICGQWSRRDYLCSQCMQGYGLSVANLYMRCVECSMSEGVGWLIFFLLQLIPVTIMFALIIVFRLSITQPPMNVFVLYSQLSLVIIYLNAVRFQPPFLSSSATCVFVTLRSIYLPVLSLWNLSFSHIMKLTNFCIRSNITHQHIYLLTYITNTHVILLIAVAYICIELHNRTVVLSYGCGDHFTCALFVVVEHGIQDLLQLIHLLHFFCYPTIALSFFRTSF